MRERNEYYVGSKSQTQHHCEMARKKAGEKIVVERKCLQGSQISKLGWQNTREEVSADAKGLQGSQKTNFCRQTPRQVLKSHFQHLQIRKPLYARRNGTVQT